MTEQLAIKDQVEESFTGDELPTQMGGGGTPTIMPGIHFFQLPANLDQCWEAKDYEKKGKDGNVIVGPDGKPAVEQHLLLKLDADNPMVCMDQGEFNGLPATSTFTTIPRKRGKKNDADAPMVADLAYLLRESLADRTPIAKRGDWIPAINRHSGAMIRLETGLSGQCSPDRVRYIDDGTGQGVEDPDGTHGCGDAAGKYKNQEGGRSEGQPETRLYTQAFKVTRFQVNIDGYTDTLYATRDEAITAATEAGGSAAHVKQVPAWSDVVTCKGCGARLRGFFRVEKFLRPLASTQAVG